MPFPMACRSLSINATSTGKSTPGRGIICRSNASPCKSTTPASTSRPRASRPNDMTPWSEPTALIFPPAICTEVSRMVLSRRARPPSINISVTILHFVVWWINDYGSSRGLVFCQKLPGGKFAEIGQGAAKRFMVPVPPLKLRQPVGNVFRKTPLDRPRRISCDNRVGQYVLGHDRARRDHRAGGDAAARQHDGAVPDPDIMTNMDVMPAPPFEELRLVALSRKIGAGAIGEVRLRGAVHGMIAGVDPRHGRDRAEPSDRGVGDLRVVHDVGIIAQRDLMQDRAGADFAIDAERCVMQFCAGIDGRFNR